MFVNYEMKIVSHTFNKYVYIDIDIGVSIS